MCGIVGYVGTQEAAPLLLEGLKRLEYRGYDSAGIATLCNGHFTIQRSAGKLSTLIEKLGGTRSAGLRGNRPHALGDARPADRAERPPAHGLQGRGRRRPQRHLRELRRAEGRSRGSRSPLHQRDGHGGFRARGRGRLLGRPLRGGPLRHADPDRRLRRSRVVERGAGGPRRRPLGPADHDRPGERRELGRVRPGRARALDARRHLPGGRRRGPRGREERPDLRRRRPDRGAPAAPDPLGRGRRRKGGIPPLHGQGDPRAADGGRRDPRGKGLPPDRRAHPRLAAALSRAGYANSIACFFWRAGRRGTPPSWASS